MAKFTRTEWSFRQIRYWMDRNKVGLILGALFGLMIFLFYWLDYGSTIPGMKYLVYPFSLLWGCAIPVWAVIVFMLFYAIIGACIDSFVSRPKQDKFRALIILLVLFLIFLAIFFYRTSYAKDYCEDINHDGIPDAGVGVLGTCTDGLKNQDEVGIDCGGAVCPACSVINFNINIET